MTDHPTLRARLGGVALLAALGLFIGGGPAYYGLHVAALFTLGGLVAIGLVAIGCARSSQRADRAEDRWETDGGRPASDDSEGQP